MALWKKALREKGQLRDRHPAKEIFRFHCDRKPHSKPQNTDSGSVSAWGGEGEEEEHGSDWFLAQFNPLQNHLGNAGAGQKEEGDVLEQRYGGGGFEDED